MTKETRASKRSRCRGVRFGDSLSLMYINLPRARVNARSGAEISSQQRKRVYRIATRKSSPQATSHASSTDSG